MFMKGKGLLNPIILFFVYSFPFFFRYLFHYISNEQGFVFMCVSDDTFGRRVPFVFLQDIEARFLSSDHQDFKKVIKERMKFYSNKDDLKKVQGEIDNVKDVMSHNIERVLERGGKIDLLVNKTDGLSQQAFGFKKRSTAVKVNYSIKYYWFYRIIIKGIIVIEKYVVEECQVDLSHLLRLDCK